MMPSPKTLCLFVGLLASAVLAETSKPDVSVTLKALTEKRELAIEKTQFSGMDNGIEITLHVDGPGVVGARKYGKVKTTQAVDNIGTDLAKSPEKHMFEDKSFREIRGPQSFGSREKEQPKPTGFDVDLKLPTPSARSATSIKTMKGELQVLVGGEKKVIVVKPLKASLGKTIDDPALKAVGVTFELVDPAKPAAARGPGAFFGPDTSKGVSVILSGKFDEIAEVDILDAAGKKLNNGSMSQDQGGKKLINYGLDKPLPADAALHIEVWPGQKTITVPFELKDVKLP